MKIVKSVLLMLMCLCAYMANAQVVYTEPAIVQENSKNIVVYFDATKGSAGLKGQSGPIYAHTGVITSKSTTSSDWKYAPSKWGDNSSKYQLTNVGTDLWKLEISDIRSYYGITDDTEVVQKLAFVFRNSTGSKTGKDVGDADIFIDVFPDGLGVTLTSNAKAVLTDDNCNVTFTANATSVANMSIYVNDINSTPIAQGSSVNTLTANYTVPTGNCKIIAKAEAGGNVALDTLSVCHRGATENATYSGTLLQGANANADGSVTFCLYAPNKKTVILVGEWDDYDVKAENVMKLQDGGYFWVTVPAGTLDMTKQYGYYFLVDDEIVAADPYAKLILDPWSDKYINQDLTIYPNLKDYPFAKVQNAPIAVFQGNVDEYNWEVTNFKAPAKENLLIYELLVRDFKAEKCMASVTDKLDYLKGLGINAIELMPIMEFDGNNSWGYNPNFYFAPDKAYGTRADYKKFIDECHKRGIAVILDVVFNHSWGQHPWCKMYWNSSSNTPSSDNPFFNATAPHNWSVGNDWKQESPAVQKYFCDVLKYWIEEFKVDGYRFDLAKGLGDSNSYSSDYDASKYNASRVANVKRFADAAKSVNSNAYIILEYFVDKSEENELGNYGCMSWKKMTNNYKQAAMGYSSSSAFTGMFTGDESRPFGSTVGYMESHDEQRIAYNQDTYGLYKTDLKTNMQRLSANAAFTILVPGAKMFWQFEEMGYNIKSGEGDTAEKAPHWEYMDDENRKGLIDNYTELLHLRANNPEMFASDASFTWSVADGNWTGGRFMTLKNADDTKEMVVVYNPTTTQRSLTYTFAHPTDTYYISSKTFGTEPSFVVPNSRITVPAHSYVVVSNFESNSGIENVTAGSDAKVNVYPNPATDYITVQADQVKNIQVYSLTGSKVAEVSGENTMSVSGLAAGTYMVKVSTENGTSVTKLIKR